jgi:hypothetical protein
LPTQAFLRKQAFNMNAPWSDPLQQNFGLSVAPFKAGIRDPKIYVRSTTRIPGTGAPMPEGRSCDIARGR